LTAREHAIMTTRDKFPCKDCTERVPGCHDRCERYKTAKGINDARKAKEREERSKIQMANEYAVRQATRGSGRKLPQK
jgi:hypothetical protein